MLKGVLPLGLGQEQQHENRLSRLVVAGVVVAAAVVVRTPLLEAVRTLVEVELVPSERVALVVVVAGVSYHIHHTFEEWVEPVAAAVVVVA